MKIFEEFLWLKSALFFKLAPYSWLDDKLKIEYLFYKEMGYRLNLRNPLTFNEKLQWMKLYYRNPIYQELVDKYAVRKYVTDKIGPEYLNELIAVFEKPEEIDWESLPKQFALKLTHGCHWNIICQDKDLLDIEDAKFKISQWYKRNLYNGAREWQYKYVKPRIIVERYLNDGNGLKPMDYKFHCFNGLVVYIQITEDESSGRRYYFNKDWELQRFNRASNNASGSFFWNKPEKIIEMYKLANLLSNPFPYARVDFFYIDQKIYFGELTFTPAGGFSKDRYPETDLEWGNLLNLQRMSETSKTS